jgi:hypothetical protein
MGKTAASSAKLRTFRSGPAMLTPGKFEVAFSGCIGGRDARIRQAIRVAADAEHAGARSDR